MSKNMYAIIAVLISAFFWSTAGAVTKILLVHFEPFSLAFLRFFIASIILLPLFLKNQRSLLTNITPTLILTLVFGAGNIIFFYYGIVHTTANTSVVLYASVPILVTLISIFFLHERYSNINILGVIIGFIGVLSMLMMSFIEQSSAFGTINGNILILIAVICWSLYSISSRYVTKNGINASGLATLSIFSNCAVFFVLMILSGQYYSMQSIFQPSLFFLVGYLAIFVSIVTFFLYQWTIKNTSAVFASLVLYLQPLFAFIVDAIVLNETITFRFIGSGMLIFIGLFFVTKKKNNAKVYNS
ncbi:DMT family transporter [Patescibacteria group bacterium]